jgi:glycosyltransferase involved in cell wall biosynthesis
VIYNPVDCGLFHPAPESKDDNLILYAGSLIERKGVFALAAAARHFLPALPQAKLLLVGRSDPAARRRIHELAGAAATQLEIRDPLPQAELAGLIRRAAVFAMPSVLESFGNVWAEAMASGTAVLGSTLSCGPEVVPDDEAGLLADPADPTQIAAAVQRLMTHPELRGRLAASGRRIALDRYSLPAALTCTVAFYRTCLA